MDWKYKMFINELYWKGYGGHPTALQVDIETRSYKNSKYYNGEKIELVIVKSK